MFSIKKIKDILIYKETEYVNIYESAYFVFIVIKFDTKQELKIHAWDINEFEINKSMSPSQTLSYASKLGRLWRGDFGTAEWVKDNIAAIDLFWHKQRLINVAKEIDELKKESVWHLEQIENLRVK